MCTRRRMRVDVCARMYAYVYPACMYTGVRAHMYMFIYAWVRTRSRNHVYAYMVLHVDMRMGAKLVQ